MASNYYIATAIIIIAIILGLILFYKRNIADSELNSQDDSQDIIEGEKRRKTVSYFLIGLAVAILIGYFIFRSYGGKGDDNNGVSIASFIPIWVAIWIPFAQKKKQKQPEVISAEKKKLLIALLIGTFVFVILTMLFTIFG